MLSAYLAADGFERDLHQELVRAGLGAALRPAHGRLFIVDAEPVPAGWALNTWLDAEIVPIASIADGARQLRARQRNWALYAPLQRGRAQLIAERLPHVSSRPLALSDEAPSAPLGSWTMLDAGVLLVAQRCSSPFPNGVPSLQEHRDGPPSRAYLKLWETLLRIGRRPRPGDRVIDLGASPGGWTWLLSELGAEVIAVDKAPLDAAVAARPGVHWRGESAFGLEPASLEGPAPTWVFGDIACYPARLGPLLQRWRRLDPAPTMVLTVKFQGETDHDAAEALRAACDGTLLHVSHNKHEIMLVSGG